MRSFIIKPGDLIPIGRAGENQATQIRFDVTGWADTFGAGTYTLVVKRPHEDTAYPVEVATDGDYVVWTVSNVDTGIAGNASVQLRYVVDGALAKSVIYNGIVGESLDNIVDPPDPFEDLIQRMVDLAERTEAAAESAAGSAASASESAGTATAAKTAAQTAAQTAQTAQGTATQAAQTATQAKDAAQAAQQAAEAAQAAAAQSATAASGSATAAAGSATQAAASATAADASAAAAAQSAAAAQAAAQNVIDKAPIITDTASGAIASFPDGADEPIKQLTVNIEPVQDLHGYDNPWPAGGRGNIFDGEVAIGGISTSNGANIEQTDRQRSVNYIPVTEGQAYYFYRSTAVAHLLYYYDSSKVFKSYVDMGTANGSFTVPTGAAYVRFVIRTTDMTANVAVNYPNSITTYSPYSNICPITGWTGAEVTRTGKNLFATTGTGKTESGVTWTINADGSVTVSGTATGYTSLGVGVARVSPSMGVVKISGTNIGVNASTNIYFSDVRVRDINKQTVHTIVSSGSSASSFTVDLSQFSDAYDIAVMVKRNNNAATNGTFMIQVEIGNTVTEWTPYAGTSYPISWQSDAGTVYGGTLTVEQDGTGTLVADGVNKICTGSDVTQVNSGNGYGMIGLGIVGTVVNDYRKCNLLDASKSPTAGDNFSVNVYNSAGYNKALAAIRFDFSSSTPAEQLQKYKDKLDELNAAGNPLQIVYKLATPVTYTLTAAEMSTLLGQNNWWADCGDIAGITYRCDTKLYIDKKLAALLAALS